MDRHAIRVVTRREIRERLRDRGYLLTTLALAGGLTALALALALGGASRDRFAVAALDPASSRIVAAAREQAPLFGVTIDARRVSGSAQARRMLSAGDLDAVVAGGRRVLAEDAVDPTLRGLLATGRGARDAPRLREVALVASGRAEAKRLALVVLPLLFVLIYLPAYFAAASVAEEKSSRVVEILLSSVHPRELLAGKILGLGLLGFAQVALAIVAGLGVATAAGFVELSGEVVALAACALACFVAGFLVYGCLFAVAGAVVSRQEDLQYAALAPTLILFAAFAAVSAQTSSAGSATAGWLALLPPTAPLMLPLRVGAGAASATEIALAVAINATLVAALLWAAGRLYAGSVLRFGGRVRLRDAWNG